MIDFLVDTFLFFLLLLTCFSVTVVVVGTVNDYTDFGGLNLDAVDITRDQARKNYDGSCVFVIRIPL
jgi:hypothetical protein